jgi:hypothetical protein
MHEARGRPPDDDGIAPTKCATPSIQAKDGDVRAAYEEPNRSSHLPSADGVDALYGRDVERYRRRASFPFVFLAGSEAPWAVESRMFGCGEFARCQQARKDS